MEATPQDGIRATNSNDVYALIIYKTYKMTAVSCSFLFLIQREVWLIVNRILANSIL